MDRRLLFPAVAMSALAQTTSPANAEAEKALRARAEQFYQLEIAKDFRHAEALVAEDSKDYFYNSGKPNLKGVTVKGIDFTDGGTRATLNLDVKVELLAPGVGAQVFTAPTISTWKLENGQWCWYFIQNNTMDTPFGKMTFADAKAGASVMDLMKQQPSADSIQSLVSIDRQSVILTASQPEQTLVISNGMPGPISLAVAGNPIKGLSVKLEKTTVNGDEKATVRFSRIGDAKPSGTVLLTASPLGIEFEVTVKSE